MNFWNLAVPTLTLLAPLVACLYFLLFGRDRIETAPRWGMVVFGLLILVSAVGIAQFENPVRLEFLWPFSAEPSGYFEFTFQLHWSRFVWIFFASLVLLIFTIFDGRDSFVRSSNPRFKFALLAGASLAMSLSFLSENVFLSLLFIETMIFFLYAFGVLVGGGDDNQERASYFKRGGFIFLALLAVLGLSLTRQFDVSSIVFLAVVLYILSFVFSKHSFTDWRHLALNLLPIGAMFFLLGRVVTEDMSQELLLPLATIFGVMVAVFAWFSLVSASVLGSIFWMVYSFLGYLLFLRLSSGRHGDQFWGAYEAVAFLSVLAIGCLLRSGGRAKTGAERAMAFGATALLLAIVSGGMPGVDIAGARVSTESVAKLAGLGLLTYLLALICGKSLALSFSKQNVEPGQGNFYSGVLPGLLVILAQAGAVVKMTDLYGESPFRMGPAYLLTNSHILVALAAILMGLLTGALLGFNSRFLAWTSSKDLTMEDIFPRIDPAVMGWNQKVVEFPRRTVEWTKRRTTAAGSRGAFLLQKSDHAIFGDRFYQSFRRYGVSLSRATRYFHTGNVRAYVFTGVVVTLFASILFLWEGR